MGKMDKRIPRIRWNIWLTLMLLSGLLVIAGVIIEILKGVNSGMVLSFLGIWLTTVFGLTGAISSLDIRDVLNKNTEILNKHTEILNKHTEILNKHMEILNGHTEILSKHTDILNKNTEILEKHTSLLQEIRDLLKK